jgi:hypothetical protein
VENAVAFVKQLAAWTCGLTVQVLTDTAYHGLSTTP